MRGQVTSPLLFCAKSLTRHAIKNCLCSGVYSSSTSEDNPKPQVPLYLQELRSTHGTGVVRHATALLRDLSPAQVPNQEPDEGEQKTTQASFGVGF